MRGRLILMIWIACILFPLASLGRLSAGSRRFLDWLLEPEWLHVLSHLLIFAGLAILLASGRVFKRKPSVTQLVLLILAAGFAQELVQFLSSPPGPVPASEILDSLFDLGVDLAGGMLGLGVSSLVDRTHKPYPPIASE